MAVELMASKLEVSNVVPPRAEEALEGNAPKLIDGQNISRVEGRSVGDLEGPSFEAPRRQDKATIDPAEVIDVGDSPLCPASSLWEIQDDYNRETSNAGVFLRGNDVSEGFFIGFEENPELNDSLIFEEVEKLHK